MTHPAFDQAIERGVAAHQSNRLEDALAAYREAVELAPGDAEANSLVGLALTHLGRLGEAGPPLEKAVQGEPDQPGFRLNLLEYLERSGDFDRAEQEIEKILQLAPDMARAWEKRGDLYLRREFLTEAADAFSRALSAEAPQFALAMKLARTQAALGNFSDTMRTLDIAAEIDPQDPALFDLRAGVLTAVRDWRRLEVVSGLWAAAHPKTIPPWRRLAEATFEQGRYRQSMAAFAKVLELAPRTADRLATYARICLHALEFDAARETLDEAEKIDPNMPDMLAAKGLMLTYRGRFEEAEEYCRRCLTADPNYANAYTQLSRLTRGHMTDEEMRILTDIADDATKPVENRVVARFALAHAYDARGEIATAFDTYAEANELMSENCRAEGLVYDPAESRNRIDRLIALFSSTDSATENQQNSMQPIFIVGMPRSGTTLVESVLAAHSRVFAGGERPMMRQILDTYLDMSAATPGDAPGTKLLGEWAALYLAETPASARADYITDKNPLNIEAVGLIARLFPGARIIHIRRNPIETGLSVFRHEFTKFWTFAHKLGDIGHFYGQYARLADHWRELLGDRFTTIQYEDFATNFDRAAPALIASCGLAWEENCASFQSHVPAIATFSAVQAREPVAVRLGKAQSYRPHLSALIGSLTAAGVNLDTGELETTKD